MPPPNPPLLAHLHFSPKEAASLFGLVRWMGTLGRLQVLGGTAGTFGAIAVIGITYALDTESAQDSANVMPLIQLGQIERSVIVIAMALLA
ncbi:MAG: hypothetical protein NZM37_03525, partial [Sandaracinaceae bacterium]|nr:hypothetical protein [Sandaracinaceae bacterium]